MGVRNYLIEGVSGSGKTTVAEALELRGHHVVHGDRALAYVGDPVTGEAVARPAGLTGADLIAWRQAHHVWDEGAVRALAADRRHAHSFFCGGSRNFARFIDVFDAVFVLEVDRGTLERRLAGRGEDEFGGLPDERALVLRLHASGEDVPRHGVRIDATMPVERVVEAILARCPGGEKGSKPESKWPQRHKGTKKQGKGEG